jgi:ABC-2 type transport system permease protein
LPLPVFYSSHQLVFNMVAQNIRHEIRLLSRNQWFVSLTIVLITLCLYAGYNGQNHFEKRQIDQQQAITSQEVKENEVREVALAVNQGEEPKNANVLSPTNVAMRRGSLAIMPANEMSKLAVGQSDLYTHQLTISAREDLATLSFNELSNPVQLLFGNFDLTFVLTYLIPLIIIAFTYNLRSQELESGRLKLLASNPIRTNLWLLQRFVIRYFSLALILTGSLVITILWIGIPLSSELFTFFLLVYAYMAVWFSISFLANILGKSSSKNAVSLISIWILLVLVTPTVINQTVNIAYPMPSRVALLNEIRETKKELSKEQDKVLDEYLRNHPELIKNEGNSSGYWQGYFASQELLEKTLEPIVNRYDQQLIKQQNSVNSWRFLSPAILFQDGSTQLAGTSSNDYNEFKSSIKEFSFIWREHFIPYVFSNKSLELSDLQSLPTYQFAKNQDGLHVGLNIISLFIISAALIGRGLMLEEVKGLTRL